MKYRRPHGKERLNPPEEEGKGTYFRVPSSYKHAIGYLPDCDSDDDGTPAASRAEIWTWVLVALSLAIIGFTCLELKSPLFFTHDDNYNSMGPANVSRMRALFSGVIPVWNPFQGGGRPIVDSGGAITYLPYFLTYGISRFLLGNEYLFIETTMLFNLLFATIGGFWAGRKWGLSPALACAFGLSFAFSGFLIITSRAWMNFSAESAWIPLIFGCCAPVLLRKASWKWALGTGAVMGCAYHAGFSQLWVYALICESIIIASLFFCGAISFRNMSWNVPAVFIAVAIALPVAWVQMDFGKDVMRNFASSASEYDTRGIPWKGLLATLIPPPAVSLTHPVFAPYESPAEGYINAHGYGIYYYSGAVFSWGCLLLLASTVLVRWSRRMLARNILLLLAVFVLLLCLGSASPIPLNKWMSSLPWFEKFRQPWRYFIFFIFFSSLAGALFFERLCRNLRNWRIAQRVVAIGTIVFIAASLAVDIPTWMVRPSDVYPPLSPDLAAVIKDPDPRFPQRVTSWAKQKEFTSWFQSKDYPDALVAFMPTVYGTLSLSRYNTLTWYHKVSRPVFDQFNNDPLNAWRAYGVRWIVCHPKVRPVDPTLFRTWTSKPVKVGQTSLLELRDPAPLAFVKGLEKEPLPISFSPKGATVQFPTPAPADEQVVVNVLAWPRFNAYADGKPVPWSPDEWTRVLVSVPAKTQTLEVLYEPPWGKGTGAGVLLLAIALGISFALCWLDRIRPSMPVPLYASWRTRLINAWPSKSCASQSGPSNILAPEQAEEASAGTAVEPPEPSVAPRKPRRKR